MKTILLLSLIFCARAFAGTPEHQVTAFTVTYGSLALDSGGVTFHTSKGDQRFPFSKPQISGTSPSSIPGLRAVRFEYKESVMPGTGSPKDVSQLRLEGDDGRAIDLVAGQPVDIYRVDITFSDQRELTLWKVDSDPVTPTQPQYVTVEGDDIRVQCRIIWTPDLTVGSAINAAGGSSGNPNVYLIRGKQRTRIRLIRIRRQQDPDPLLLPGDQIEVDQGSF